MIVASARAPLLRFVAALFVVCVSTLCSTGRAAAAENGAGSADEPSRVHWHPEWARFRPAEYVATGIFAGTALTLSLAVHQPSPSWRGGILFDAGVRGALRASSRNGRERAATTSDVLLYTTLALPVLGDAAIAALGVHHESDVALQMTLIEAESFSLSFALEIATKRLAARERPVAAECSKDPSYSPACGKSLDGSFYSGHTNGTFTAAGLVCTNHLNFPLFGGGAPDIAACAGALGLATTTGVLRIVADRHYSSDVLVGAGTGLATGMLVPWLLHYRTTGGSPLTVVPVTGPGYASVFVTGWML